MNRKYSSIQERIMANSVISTEFSYDGTPCWDWIGQRGTTKDRYPQMSARVNGKVKTLRAHRESYKAFVDPNLPCDLEIDHKCARPICVAPLHLAAVTAQQNLNKRVWKR